MHTTDSATRWVEVTDDQGRTDELMLTAVYGMLYDPRLNPQRGVSSLGVPRPTPYLPPQEAVPSSAS